MCAPTRHGPLTVDHLRSTPHHTTAVRSRLRTVPGCGITGVQYVVREGEDNLSGALVSMTCGTSGCTDEEKYSTGVMWEHVYYFLQVGLHDTYL